MLYYIRLVAPSPAFANRGCHIFVHDRSLLHYNQVIVSIFRARSILHLLIASVMEHDSSLEAITTTRPRLYGIVHTYIQKHLPRNIHPAFKALRDSEEISSTLPQKYSTEDTALPLVAGQTQTSRVDQVGGNEEHSVDLPL